MALLERVSTLLRANLNDLIDRAEDPEKMVKQLILDMENQLMQVKTQVAITITDLHMLERRRDDNLRTRDEWMRKAELAVTKHQDDLARIAIERALESKKLSEGFDEQIGDQKTQAENLKAALRKLDDKLAEARAKSELLMTRHRRARASIRAGTGNNDGPAAPSSVWDRMSRKVSYAEAMNQAHTELQGDDVEGRFAAMEKHDEVERLLTELKTQKEMH